MSGRVAVVLFNLGGPDSPETVRPFLYNLFADPAIIRLPQPLRGLLALVLSRRRAKAAKEIYAKLGGGSPLLPNTRAQAAALEAALADLGTVRVFVAMRYWQPTAPETALEVQAFRPDEILLLPLYPQFSTTTTASSIRAWRQACQQIGLAAPTRAVCCWPTEAGFVAAMAAPLRKAHADAAQTARPRVLFSAHGLPERVVKAGDPYQWQCERTAAALAEASGILDLDWVVTYQSRVGPLKWLGPGTDEAIVAAGRERRPVVVVPIAFVSEHSETLVELDIDYAELAHRSGVPRYLRVSTAGADPAFIAGLERLARTARGQATECSSANGGRLCPAGFGGCPVPVEMT